MDKIIFRGEDENLELCILDETKLAGRTFLLVSDVSAGDGSCYIMEQTGEEGGECCYEFVDDETLLDQLANIFGEQTEDADIEF